MSTFQNIRRTLCVAIAGVTCAFAAQADIVVIVNPKSATASLTSEQVGSLYLGKATTLPSGASVAMVDQSEGSPIHEQFYSKAAGKTPSQVKAAWSRLTFSGKATPPKSLANSTEVKKYIASNPEAIGYIEKSAVDASVKVVLHVE